MRGGDERGDEGVISTYLWAWCRTKHRMVLRGVSKMTEGGG